MERRSRVLRRLFSLREPRPREARTAAVALAALPALLAVAVAQPVVVHRQLVSQRSDAEMFVVFDTSQSMSAQSSPEAPTRLERAKRELEDILPQLGDLPVGLGTMTDRVLPNLMPTTNDALIRRTLDESIGINEPPPSRLYDNGTATNLNAIFRIPAFRLYSPSASKHSILVVFTDGESPPLGRGTGVDLAKGLTIPPLFVHTWAPTERVYVHGRIDPRYQPNPHSTFILQQLAQATRGKVFAENDLSGLVQAIRNEAGPTRKRTTLLGYSRVALGQWFLLVGVIPLGFLFWRRNL